MSNPLIVELRLEGSIPSKKNSRINTRDGLSFPSKDFSNWQKSVLTQVRMQTKHRFFKPVSLEVIVYFATDARADLDNKLTSILDMLVEGMVLRDDKWQEVPMISVQAAYRPKKAGAFIRLTELPADVMGEELEAVRAKRRPRNKLMVK